jgi:hypothetical protein
MVPGSLLSGMNGRPRGPIERRMPSAGAGGLIGILAGAGATLGLLVAGEAGTALGAETPH